MQVEKDSKDQVKINQNDIAWLKRSQVRLEKGITELNSTVFKIMIAVAFGAFGFIGTLLMAFLKL